MGKPDDIGLIKSSTMDVGSHKQIDVLESDDIKVLPPEIFESEIDRQDSRANLVETDELVCGIGPCRPRFLQFIAGGPKAFAFWSMLYLLIKTSSTVYLGSTLGTIEKQFKLSSTESGAIVVINDIMDFTLVIFVAYFGHKGHRPRIMAVGILLAGIGIAMCGFPHYMLEPKTNKNSDVECNQTQKVYVDYCALEQADQSDPCSGPVVDESDLVIWLIVGQVLLGIGNVPVKPLGTTYIDDAVGHYTTPIYIAFLFIAGSMGPLLGFVFGSQFLSFFVDFDRVAETDRPIYDASDPRFIGAWWLGYICLGCFVMLISIPFFFFPRIMPKTKERVEEESEKAKKLKEKEDDEIQMKSLPLETSKNGSSGKEVEAHGENENESPMKLPLHITFFKAVKQMYRSYKRMIMNLGLLLLCLSTSMEGANAAANGSFTLKYYSVEFAVTPSYSSLLAIIVFPFNLVGCMVGGYIMKRRKWNPEKCALFLLFGDVVSIVLVPVFLTFGCETQVIAGVYGDRVNISKDITLLGSVEQANLPCNMNCTCGNEAYNPVCGSDGITYASPCYAGCMGLNDTVEDDQNRTIYSFYDCNCITPGDMMEATAVGGECAPKCQEWQVPVLIATSIVLIFASGLGQSALVLITLRIVDENMRSAAIGLQTIFLNGLGYLPAPLYVGAVIDAACILWEYDKSDRGACWAYNRDGIRYAFQGVIGLFKVLSSLLLVGVYFAIRNKRKREESMESEKSDNKIP